jgi:hypothetical protein
MKVGEIIDLLHDVAEATKTKGRTIKGNPELERRQADDIKALEDILTDGLQKEFGINYVRQYEHLYRQGT